MWDEEEAEPVRKAAGEALHEMSTRLRKHRKIVSDLESELENKNYQGIIDILIATFEQSKTKHVQSAYLIGHQFMRLNRYLDAREWLKKAESRNRKFNLYRINTGQISYYRYCKLEDYRNADQAALAALRYSHESDLTLTLVPLLQKIVMPDGNNVETADKREEIERAIDERASAIMKKLLARDAWHQAG